MNRRAPPSAFFWLHWAAWPVGVTDVAMASALATAGLPVKQISEIVGAGSLGAVSVPEFELDAKTGPIPFERIAPLQGPGEPLEARRARLPALVTTDAAIRLSQDLPGTAAEVIKAVRAAGTEGVIANAGVHKGNR